MSEINKLCQEIRNLRDKIVENTRPKPSIKITQFSPEFKIRKDILSDLGFTYYEYIGCFENKHCSFYAEMLFIENDKWIEYLDWIKEVIAKGENNA